MKKLRFDLPYISPFRFFSICIFLVLVILLIDKIAFYYVSKDLSQIDYIWNSIEAKTEVANQIANIHNRLKNKDYWDIWWPWWVIFSYSFYGYSLVNIYLENPLDIKYKTYAQNELVSIYNFLITDWLENFKNKGTKIEHWIIYEWTKNQILASLVILGKEEYKKSFYENSDKLEKNLEASKWYSWESYPSLAWYIDNIHAYYSLYLADKIRVLDWLPPKYHKLITDWISGMKMAIDKKWITLAEVYTTEPENNQARWCAQAWLLVYMYELDRWYFNDQYPKFLDHFYRIKSWFWLVYDVPDWEELINAFSWWPALFWYSSSATALSLPLFKLTSDKPRYISILRTLTFLLDYEKEHWSYTLWYSSLLDSLNLWWKTHVTWWDKLDKVLK